MSDIKWEDALKVSELPHVAEALFNFAQDSTEDNAVGLILAVMLISETRKSIENLRTDIAIENLRHRIKELEEGHDEFNRAIKFALEGKDEDGEDICESDAITFLRMWNHGGFPEIVADFPEFTDFK